MFTYITLLSKYRGKQTKYSWGSKHNIYSEII